MADIVKFPEANTTYVGTGCLDLPVFREVDENGSTILISCWQLSPEEMAEVARTGRIYLHIWGGQQPPVYVNGHRPFVAKAVDN